MRKWTDLELETWIVKAGDDVVEKEAARGRAALSLLEKLIYCVWVADYGMRNAGDLVIASDVYSQFQEEAASLAHLVCPALTLHSRCRQRTLKGATLTC